MLRCAALLFVWALAAHSLELDAEKAESIRLSEQNDVPPVPVRFSYEAQPCIAGSITIALASSPELSAAFFQRQLDFLTDSLLTDDWNHLDRLAVVQYNDEDVFFQRFTHDQTTEDVRQQLRRVEQQNGPGLRDLLEDLDAWQTERPNEPVHLIVFTSESPSTRVELGHVQSAARSLESKNYVITFVAVGSDVDDHRLAELSPHVIVWDIANEQQPVEWEAQFEAAFGCAEWPVLSTTTKRATTRVQTTKVTTPSQRPTTTNLPATTTTPDDVYTPCGNHQPLQVNIFFDDGRTYLTYNEFTTVKNFLKYSFFDGFNHFERLTIQNCDSSSCQYHGPQEFGSLPQVQQFLTNAPQYSVGSSIGVNIKNWVVDNREQAGFAQAYIFFAAKFDTNDANLLAAYTPRLRAPLWIVAVKGANQTLIRQSGFNVIDWSDLSADEPTGWKERLNDVYGCTNTPTTPAVTNTTTKRATTRTSTVKAPSTTKTSTTATTTRRPTTTTRRPTTTTSTKRPTTTTSTKRPTTTTTKLPSTSPADVFVPCGNDRKLQVNVFVEDGTQVLSGSHFLTIKNFLKDHMFNEFNHFERVTIQFCDSASCIYAGPFAGLGNLQNYIQNRGQYNYGSAVGRQVENIQGWISNQDSNEIDGYAQTYLFFAASFDANDADLLATYAPRLNGPLTFVALGSANQTLIRLSGFNVVDWSDLSQPAPTDWKNTFQAAYGCTAWPSTPTPTTTTVAPVVYTPCGNSEKLQINAFIDDSSIRLTSQQFTKMKTFLSNQLFAQWNHFERLMLAFCDSYSCIYSDAGSFNTLQAVRSNIDGKHMYNYESAIGTNIQDWVQNRQSQKELAGFEQRYIFFASDFDQSDAQKLRTYAPRLDGPLTIVAVKNANQTLIREEGYPLIDWSQIDTSVQPANWEALFQAAYGCAAWPTTKRPATTTTPALLSGAYLPCNNDEKRQINIFVTDSSQDLTRTEFNTVKDFLRLALLNNWNEYYRLSLSFCDSDSCLWYGGNYFTSWETVDAYLDTRQQYSYPSAVGPNIKSWTLIDREMADHKQSYVFLTAKFEQQDADLLKIYGPKLNGPLSFIALKDANQTLIRQSGFNVVDWSDLTRSSPVNWAQQMWNAYGCSGNSPYSDEEVAANHH
ncbi:hypothetical protein M3Y99_00928700 [Aphelenchoides fujianensis]|nr:hypothetical protein M3Y99_00928700 [Aphelenchoides fujianensis]